MKDKFNVNVEVDELLLREDEFYEFKPRKKTKKRYKEFKLKKEK